MKILHVITSLEIGGAQKLISDLLPLQAASKDVTLLVYERVYNDFERIVENAGIDIICLNEHNFYNPYVIFRLRKIFKNFDLIHAHLFPTIYWASLAARGLDIKLIYTEHSTSNSRRDKFYFRPIERFMYSRFDKIISISQQVQDALTTWLGQCDERFIVIPNGVNLRKFVSIKSTTIPKSLIMVSRFVPSKDQETIIHAMKYIDNEATLRFVGDGENREHCERLAKELGVTDRVYFLGSRTDVPELLASSYIGIQSSNWEGFGLTAVEIMACGKPIIASNVDGLKQVVDGAGIIFSLGNITELSLSVNRLLTDEQYYEMVARRCKLRALEYDINIMNERYLRVYSY